MSGTATLIRANLLKFNGVAHLYRLDPPLVDYAETTRAEYVIVSATRVLGRPETYIFAATPDGDVASWIEMRGSMRDTLAHADALANAGYEIVDGGAAVQS